MNRYLFWRSSADRKMICTRINVPGCDLNVPEASKQRFDVLDAENIEGGGGFVDWKQQEIEDDDDLMKSDPFKQVGDISIRRVPRRNKK